MEKLWRSDEDRGASRRGQLGISGRHVGLSLNPHRVGHSWDATQPSIEPTSVTAGHTAKTNLSHGGL